MANLARRLQRLISATEPQSDADLLDRFVTDRDGLAFAALVGRHGPMVLAVCRRVLRHRQDAEDAFQATFLVLARRAAVVKPRSLLGNWLYGVAYRTALSARRITRVQRAREAKAAALRVEDATAEGVAPELREALDRELAALPEVYRAAVVACDLEGLSRREAATRLGWTEGTLSSRLARARSLLARRLARYGLVLPVAGLMAAAGPVAVAGELVGPTVRLGTLMAAGEAVVAAPVAALMEGAMGTMLMTKVKALAAAVVVGCAVAVTSVAGWRADAAADPSKTTEEPKPADPPKRVALNPDKERIAELERERAQLLKRLADLEERLARIEAGAEATRLDNAKRAADLRIKAAADEEAARAAGILASPAPKTTPASPNHPTPKLPLPPDPLPGAAPSTTPRGPVPPVPVPDRSVPSPERPDPLPGSTPSITPRGPVPPVPVPDRSVPVPETSVTPPTPASGLPREPLGTPRPESPSSAIATPAAKAVVKVYPVGDLVDEKDGEALAKVLRATVDPASWGMDAGVEYMPGRKVLVIRQTPKGHKEVDEVLQLLQKPSAQPRKR